MIFISQATFQNIVSRKLIQLWGIIFGLIIIDLVSIEDVSLNLNKKVLNLLLVVQIFSLPRVFSTRLTTKMPSPPLVKWK